ncbi:MAG: hypothetical protein WC829_05025 [Hyphomicrobium sp.]|jgi:hypothetical protein
MSRRELEIGSFVQVSGLEAGNMLPEASYRIEQLLRLNDGVTLYKIRNDAEPFDHVVTERQLIIRTFVSTRY